MIMDAHSFFKLFLNPRYAASFSQEKAQTEYNKEANAYQDNHNRMHPGEKIWIHDYDTKVSTFFINGSAVEIEVLVRRFIYSAGPLEGKTFVFMGSMLVSGSKYSKQYILMALLKGKEAAMAKAEVSSRTLQRWRDASRAHMRLFCSSISVALAMLNRTGDSFRACLFILTTEAGRFPLCTLR